MVSYILKGEAFVAAGAFVVDALTPLSWPKGEWNEKKIYALTHYAMIAGTIQGTVTAIFTTGVAFYLAATLAPTALIGAFVVKHYSLLRSIEIDTANLDKIEKKYKADTERLSGEITKLKSDVDQLQKMNASNEQLMKERDNQLSLLTKQLSETGAQITILQKNVATLKEIPSTFGNRIEQLAGKISDFTKDRKELNDDLKKSIEEQKSTIQTSNAALKDSLSRLDKENSETGQHLTILGKLIDSLENVVNSILSLYKEVEASIEKLKEEIKSLQIDKLISVLEKEGADADQISQATAEAKAEIAKSAKNQAELEKLIEKSKTKLREIKK